MVVFLVVRLNILIWFDANSEMWLSFCPMTLTIGEFKYLWFGLKSFQSVIAIHLYSSALCDSIECHFRITSSVRIFSSSHDRHHFVNLSSFIVFHHYARCHVHFYYTMQWSALPYCNRSHSRTPPHRPLEMANVHLHDPSPWPAGCPGPTWGEKYHQRYMYHCAYTACTVYTVYTI